MSTEGEPSWDSLPDHLKTSKLAHAICPEQAADAEVDLETRLFWGRFAFHGFSREELGAYIWRKWGPQLSAQSDAVALAWLDHMGFREHAAFDGMADDAVLQFLRSSSGSLDDYVDRYSRSGDFHIARQQAGLEPRTEVAEQIAQARQLMCEDPTLQSVLPSLLAHGE